jgi:hypothetical protein
MKPRSAKSKGMTFQKEICRRIAKLLGIEFNNKDDTCPIHSRESGQSGTDVVIRDKKLLKKFPFSIECKRTEKLQLYKSINQARENKLQETDWLLIARRNRENPIVIMDFDTFEKLYKNNYAYL